MARVTKGIFTDFDYSDLLDHSLGVVQSRQGQNSGLTIFLLATTAGTFNIVYRFPIPSGAVFQTDPVVADTLLVVNIPYGIPQADLYFQATTQPGNVKMEVVNY
jgi:hypothetical protein